VFEQVCASFEIVTTRAISPQILRHRSFTFQEASQRYCDPLDVLEGVVEEVPYFDLRAQDLKNRQNSVTFEDQSLIERTFRDRILGLFEQSQELYNDMLQAGVAKECARNVLLMCVPTRLHMMGTLRSWIFYVGLRAAPGTQAEHRTIAQQVGAVLGSQAPIIREAILDSLTDGKNGALEGWRYI
jgi:thymidylate synthase (FAD)